MNEAIISYRGPGHLWLASLGVRGMQLGLARMHALLQRLGRPQTTFLSVVVAGTDGKGSTSAMLAQMLEAAGLSVGLYTSPHLMETRERVRIGPVCVSQEALDDALRQVQSASDAAEALDLTPFEALTAAAFCLFRDAGVAIAVLEIGLGGRLDAVNAVEPIVSIITNLSHDHTAILGNTLAQIAYEKAGVARAARPLIVANGGLIKSALRKHNVEPKLLTLGQDLVVDSYVVRGSNWHAAGLLSGPALPLGLSLELELPGRHQLDNAALAVLGYQQVAEYLRTLARLLPSVDEVASSLGSVDWPCRAEIVEQDPIVVLDAAHNPAAIGALSELLAERGRGWQVILAVRKDRDAADVVRAIKPIADSFWLPRMHGETLMNAEELSTIVDAVAPSAGVAVADFARCFAQARREALPGAGVVLTGSQHALGEWLARGIVSSPRLLRRLGRI